MIFFSDLMKFSEMSYYPRQVGASSKAEPEYMEDTKFLQGITSSRRAVMESCSQCSNVVSAALNQVDWNVARMALIASAIGSTFLYTVARKKTRTSLRMILYPTIVGGFTAAVCYPQESSTFAKEVLHVDSLPAVPLPVSLSQYVRLNSF